MVDLIKMASEMAEECGLESVTEGPDPDAESTHTDLDDSDDIENVDTRPKSASEFVFKSLAYFNVRDILRVVTASFLKTGNLQGELIHLLDRGHTVEQILLMIQSSGEQGESPAISKSIREVLLALGDACESMAKTEVLDEYDWTKAAQVVDSMAQSDDPVETAKLIEDKIDELPSLDESEITPEDVD